MIVGLFGRPWLDVSRALEAHMALPPGGLGAALDVLHDEICLGLSEVPLDYTGGSHRSMEIMPASRTAEAGTDYGEVIASFTPEQYRTFRELADEPASLPDEPGAGLFGEERAHPLTRRQMLWLEHRFGVYFPWKAYVEMIPNRRWEDKSRADGKAFTRLARSFFPRTIDFVKRLPFTAIGRCNVMGLAANDHGTVHRDAVPADHPEPDHFITLCPGGNKRLFLWDEELQRELPVEGRAYWFNDADWHGVSADPWFRYSVRVDGVFQPDFVEALIRGVGT